jgi:branched-chain amino acid aminotransferase
VSVVDRIVWRDGEFVRWGDATVHILAQSLQRGSLAFDYMSVHQAKRGVAVFRLADHIERLFKTCALMGLPIAYEPVELVEGCAETVRKNPGATSLKISALIPSVEAELVPQQPRVGVFICAYDSKTDIVDRLGGSYQRRLKGSLKVEREISSRRPDIIPPQAKMAANYTSAMFAKWRARKEGFDDIVLLDGHGEVAEATTSNIFLVNDTGLVTPPDDKVLLGITRASIIEIAAALGIGCDVRTIGVAELHCASEVFLTATSVGVWPIIEIDRQRVGTGEIGTLTTRLQKTLACIATGDDAEFEHWLYYV